MIGVIDCVAPRAVDRGWVHAAVRRLHADGTRSADTHLVKLSMTDGWKVDMYVKDESTHPTGSLKHRLARSLFLHALCSGVITPDTTIVEASSGSTAVSEAYFARMLGLEFIAVMPASTSPRKIALIEGQQGRCHLVEHADAVYDEARRLADAVGGHYLDQFTNAERATDWRGNNNIAESIFEQMAFEPHPVPEWVVVGAGTGGTSATIGRYTRYRGFATRLAVVDPEGSAFLPAFQDRPTQGARGSRIEGIGRPRVEPSFVPGVVDRMLGVPDAGSIAAMHFLRDVVGIPGGASTGTNFYGALMLACETRAQDRAGSIVTLQCDHADRYQDTYANSAWLAEHDLTIADHYDLLATAWTTGAWTGQ
jgi:cysteine synthase A